MSNLPQRLLMPTIKECTNGSGVLSETQSQRSGTQRSVPLVSRETENQLLKSDHTMMYTISNTKGSSYKPSEAKDSLIGSQRPLRDLQNRINKCVIEEDNARTYPQAPVYPTFNPSYSSLNPRPSRSSEFEIEYEREQLEKKLNIYKGRIRTISQGNDEEKCSIIKDFFAERNPQNTISHRIPSQHSNQKLINEYESNTLNKENGSLHYDQYDPEVLQLTESQQNEEANYRYPIATEPEDNYINYRSKFEEKQSVQIERLMQEKLQLRDFLTKLDLDVREKDRQIVELNQTIDEYRSENRQQNILAQRAKSFESQNKDLNRTLGELQQNQIQNQQVITDLSQQRDAFYTQLQVLKSQIQTTSQLQKNQQSNSSFLLNDRSNLLCDITYDQDSSRNDQSFYMRNRRVKSLHRKTCGNSTDDQARKMKQHEKFLQSIQDMILKLTPSDTYKNRSPTLKECWSWIKKILGDYMSIKKHNKSSGNITSILVELLEVDHQDQILEEVVALIKMLTDVKKMGMR